MKVNGAAARWLERRVPNVFASVDCYAPLCRVIEKPLETEWVLRIVEIGGIDCPLFRKSPVDEYACVNIEGFADADRVYDRFVVQLIEEPVYLTVDLVISNTLLEHVPNNRQAIPNIFGALRDGGENHRYVPSNRYPYSYIAQAGRLRDATISDLEDQVRDNQRLGICRVFWRMLTFRDASEIYREWVRRD